MRKNQIGQPMQGILIHQILVNIAMIISIWASILEQMYHIAQNPRSVGFNQTGNPITSGGIINNTNSDTLEMNVCIQLYKVYPPIILLSY